MSRPTCPSPQPWRQPRWCRWCSPASALEAAGGDPVAGGDPGAGSLRPRDRRVGHRWSIRRHGRSRDMASRRARPAGPHAGAVLLHLHPSYHEPRRAGQNAGAEDLLRPADVAFQLSDCHRRDGSHSSRRPPTPPRADDHGTKRWFPRCAAGPLRPGRGWSSPSRRLSVPALLVDLHALGIAVSAAPLATSSPSSWTRRSVRACAITVAVVGNPNTEAAFVEARDSRFPGS